MKHLRPTGIVTAILLLLAVGCSGISAQPATPTPSPEPTPSLTQPAGTTPTAKIKSITPAKAVTAGSGGGPRLAIDAEAIDFGDVQFGDVVAYSFNVKNVGTAPLQLDPTYIRVKQGC